MQSKLENTVLNDNHIMQVDSIDPATLYLNSLAKSGRRAMRSLLKTSANMIGLKGEFETLPWQLVEYQHLAFIRNELQRQNKSSNTINLALSGLRGVMKACFHIGLIDSDRLMRINEIKRVRVQKLPSGRSLCRAEINKLVKTCEADRGAAGERDLAILALMLSTGLRRSEVVDIDVGEYNVDTGDLLVSHGKGDKQRIVYVSEETATHMKAGLRTRGQQRGKLFLPIHNKQIINRKMSSQSIYDLVGKRAREAGIENCRPHDLRRTFVTRLLEAGVDIHTVSQLAGHSDIQTTARYDLRDQSEQRKAIKNL
jgi:integrase/recombinase XerD